jgi:hypothetical protein
MVKCEAKSIKRKFKRSIGVARVGNVDLEILLILKMILEGEIVSKIFCHYIVYILLLLTNNICNNILLLLGLFIFLTSTKGRGTSFVKSVRPPLNSSKSKVKSLNIY